jgi:diaminopimelate epimerase
MRKTKFVKYHALGNDYLVIRPSDIDGDIKRAMIERICHRHYGIGSDGILLGPLESSTCDFKVRIFNPDGSEAEKSGNGLRIFSRFLWDEGLVHNDQFTIETLGGPVTCRVEEDGKQVTVEMGHVSFLSTEIPVTGRMREVLNEEMTIAGRTFKVCAATVGNPHCVVICEDPSAALACQYGPLIERDARFPKRTNVQFMRILDRHNIRIEIWERGAGYTLASGSSATAAAAVAHKLGLCDAAIAVHMPGGRLDITLTEEFTATMRGSVQRICTGVMDSQIFET